MEHSEREIIRTTIAEKYLPIVDSLPRLPLSHSLRWSGEYPEAFVEANHIFLATREGNYPYECTIKDKRPNAMIYYSDCGSWDLLHH